MLKKYFLWSLWLGFIIYIIFFAPPLHLSDTISLLGKLFTLKLSEINPVILSLFSLIGVWLYIYSSLLFFDGRMQSIPFWPFAIAATGTGVIGLLPYLALRQDNSEFIGDKNTWLKLLDSRLSAMFVLLFTSGLLIYALGWGDWEGFWQQFQADRFINGMSLAFCLFGLLFPTILEDDMKRRGYYSRSWLFWLTAVIFLFGPLFYLCWRKPLSSTTVINHPTQLESHQNLV